jgi:hypothetical protein
MLHKALMVLALGAALVSGREARATTNLVVNGGFDLPLPNGSFNGWTTSGDVTLDSTFANSACCDAALGTYGGNNGTVSQFISTNLGGTYSLSFALLDESDSSQDSLSVTFGAFSQIITGDQTSGNYATFMYPIIGTGSSTELTFEALSTIVDADMNLDDVTLSCTSGCGGPSPTPVPPTLSLFATALILWLGVAYIRRRQLRV